MPQRTVEGAFFSLSSLFRQARVAPGMAKVTIEVPGHAAAELLVAEIRGQLGDEIRAETRGDITELSPIYGIALRVAVKK